MSEVAFHFGAPDKLAYACRLLRKAAGSGARVVVLADPAVVAHLDTALWGMGAVDFVPHGTAVASASVLRHSPVVLTSQTDIQPAHGNEVLVQLTHPVPACAAGFSRVIEVVSLDEADRLEARHRWKTYAATGQSIQRHDLALKEQS